MTARGNKALRSAESAQEAIEDDVLQALSAEERETLWRLLSRALVAPSPATTTSRPARPTRCAATSPA